MDSSVSPYLSLVVPVRDEAENIETLAGELTAVFDRQEWSWECIWVDDGSKDQSLSLLRRLAQSDRRHRYLAFVQNAGQSAALWGGFRAGKGKILATLDGDGQNDPADIPRLVEIINSGQADMVNGYRAKRHDNAVRKISSLVANNFRNWVTGESVKDAGSATRAFKRECVENLPKFSGLNVFLPTLVAMKGFRISEVPVNHRPRLRGKSKYNIRNRIWKGLIDCFGVLWLKKRSFQYTIEASSNEK